jgi:hypothetical protein
VTQIPIRAFLNQRFARLTIGQGNRCTRTNAPKKSDRFAVINQIVK